MLQQHLGVGGILSAKDIYEKIKIGALLFKYIQGLFIMGLGILKDGNRAQKLH